MSRKAKKTRVLTVLLFTLWGGFVSNTVADPTTIVTKEHHEQFGGGRKHFVWSYTPTVRKSGTKDQLVIQESFKKIKDGFCGVVGEMELSGPYGSIRNTKVSFTDGSSASVNGNVIDIDGKTVDSIKTQHQFSNRTWNSTWSNVSLTGGIDVLEFFIADHQFLQLKENIMIGESFVIILITDTTFPSPPTVTISTDEQASLSTTLTFDPDALTFTRWLDVPEPGNLAEKPHVSNRFVLDTSTGGGSFPSIGKTLKVEAFGKTIGLPIIAPQIELRVVPADSPGPDDGLPSLIDSDPFFVEAHVPRAFVNVTRRFGETLSVELKSRDTGDSDTLELQSAGNLHGRIVYHNEEEATLSDGSLGALSDYMGPIDISPYDELTITLEQDPSVKLTIPAYVSDTQRSIAILRQRFLFLRDFYSQGMQTPDISDTSREALHRKLQLVKNALVVIDYDREINNDDPWNDWKKLAIAMKYDKLTLQDASKWTQVQSAAPDRRFKFITLWVEEQNAITTGTQAGINRARWALGRMHEIVFEGVYAATITFTGVNQAYTAITATDGFGRKVNLTERVLAGTEVVSMAILMGAHTIQAARTVPGPAVQPGRGINAFYNKRGGTRLLNRGMRAEDWLTEVVGTGRHGGSQKEFEVGGVMRQYDGYDHIRKSALEAKTGRLSFSGEAKTQFLNDIEMLKRHPEVQTIEWHFFVSEKVYCGAYAGGVRGEALLTKSMGPVKGFTEALKAALPELRALGKDFKFVYHKTLMF